MSVEIKKVVSKADLKKFIRFNYELYRDNAFSVPDLYEDMLDTFQRDKNPAFDFCEADYFLAYKDGQLVGRVAAIINRRANETWKAQKVRFGWIDFVDDREVSRALIDTVKAWGRERGMTEIEGPLGFTDMDAEGMLIEGFDQLSTMATIYNFPYYPEHLEALGFEKAADWVEMKIYIPDAIPEKHKRISDIIARKYDLRLRKLTDFSPEDRPTALKDIVRFLRDTKMKREVMRNGFVHRLFALINDAYTPLFGFSRMTDRQIDKYVNTYIPLLDLRMVSIVETAEGEIVAVGISMASLSEALQKAKGRLFPFGWWHMLRSLVWHRPKMLDLLLVAVRPDFQSKGVNALLFTDLIPVYQQLGFEYAESNPELEVNDKVQSQWQYFRTEQHKRRRCFKQSL